MFTVLAGMIENSIKEFKEKEKNKKRIDFNQQGFT